MALNKGQQNAKDIIMGLVESHPSVDDRYCMFFGPAGTGKTYTFVDIIKSLPSHLQIGLTAPTHKAVKVMRAMAYKAGIDKDVDIRTIHSALGLSMKQVENVEVLYRDDMIDEKYYDILFVDESSMIGKDLASYIIESESKVIVFVGDRRQINPVDAEDGELSVVFDIERKAELTQIMRQGDGNPIIDIAEKLALCQDDDWSGWPEIKTKLNDDGSGVNVLARGRWFGEAIEIFKSPKFKANPDHCRCITYTNDSVDVINRKIREHIHGKDVANYLVGEILVAQSAGKLHKNAEEVKIMSIEETLDEEYKIPCYEMTLISLDTDGMYRVNVLKPESVAIFQNKLDEYANLARNIDVANKRKHWANFWGLRKTFNEFKHIYAMTAHKSQGSTFDHSFVYTPNFLRFGETKQMKQLMYTATTRASFRTTFAH